MDLLDITWESRLFAAYQAFARVCQQRGIALPVQTPGAHRLDREVINYAVWLAARQRETIQVVRAAFPEGPPIYPGSYLDRRAHVQIAVRDRTLLQRCWQESPP